MIAPLCPSLAGSAILSSASLSWIGWVATAVFACSYFARTPARLRVIQGVAALMWVAYGLLIHAIPVVVANVIVAVAAGYTSSKSLLTFGSGVLAVKRRSREEAKGQ